MTENNNKNNTMTNKQRIEHKKGNAERRRRILAESKGKKYNSTEGNLCIRLGGVGQQGKY